MKIGDIDWTIGELSNEASYQVDTAGGYGPTSDGPLLTLELTLRKELVRWKKGDTVTCSEFSGRLKNFRGRIEEVRKSKGGHITITLVAQPE